MQLQLFYHHCHLEEHPLQVRHKQDWGQGFIINYSIDYKKLFIICHKINYLIIKKCNDFAHQALILLQMLYW